MERLGFTRRISAVLAIGAIALSACTGTTSAPSLTFGPVFTAGPTVAATEGNASPTAAESPAPSAGGVPESSTGPAETPPANIAIYISEWSVGLPTSIVAGKITFDITNIGNIQHELLVFKSDLKPAAFPLDKNGDIVEDGPGITLVSDGENIDPGKSQSRTVDLSQPGTYVFICNIPGHFHAGMFRVVTVTQPATQQAYIPAALSEWHIATPSTISAGSVILEAANFGTIQHELLVFKGDLPPSQYPLDANGDIVEDGPGITLLSDADNIDPGRTQARVVDLSQPGTYLFVCNIPGHFKAGMYSTVTVTP